jgi:murein L,D-transpeptidase YafK
MDMKARSAASRSVLLLGFALVLLAAAVVAVQEGSWYRTIDRARMAMRHLNQRLHYGLGWQLPGTPDLAALDSRLKEKGLSRGDPVFMRVFKNELELELWMQQGDRFVLFATYPVCYWSGRLGPKIRTGDKQAPEGFYSVTKGQLNPNSRWHRSFNVGFPNLLDQAHGRTGSYLMVHGGCSSVGCYAMTNPVITEIWELVTAALDKGQGSFGIHIFPFRLTEARLNAYDGHAWAGFWRDMKPGYDLFEASHIPPQISICQKRYVAEPGAPGAKTSVPRNACPAGGGSNAGVTRSGAAAG